MLLRRGDRVQVSAPEELRGREGWIEVPVWTAAEGARRVGVRLNDGRLVWATAVEVFSTGYVKAE